MRDLPTDLLVNLLAFPPGDGLHHHLILGVALLPGVGAALLLLHLLALLLVTNHIVVLLVHISSGKAKFLKILSSR